MPWSKKNIPGPAKNWSPAAQAVCIRVANATLKNGGSDTDAIRACIGAVKRSHPGTIKTPKRDWKGRKHDDVSALAFTAGFYALPKIELEEGESSVSTLQVLPQGKFKHPWYGDLDFSEPRLRTMQRNFDRKVLGIDVMVDEGHDRSKALGWFKGLKHRNRHVINGVEYAGLFAEIEWNDLGRDLLERDIYRYFSAEVGSYTDATGKKYTDVVFGGGLTNRPFFKQMPAVQFEDGTADDRFLIGLFDDRDWSFSDVEEDDEEDDGKTFFSGYSSTEPDPDEDEEDDDDEEEDEDEAKDVKFSDLIAKLNREYSLVLSDSNETEVAEAIEHAFSSQAALVKVRKAFSDAGFKFDSNSDIAGVVLAGYNALKTQNTENAEAIKEIRQELDDTRASTAVDKLIEAGKVAPAKRDQYIRLYGTNNELFEDLTKDLTPTLVVGEIGGDGTPLEPGHGSAEAFKDTTKATEEADRYMNLVPVLEDRLAARKK
jgi:Mu-like prophage I protein